VPDDGLDDGQKDGVVAEVDQLLGVYTNHPGRHCVVRGVFFSLVGVLADAIHQSSVRLVMPG